MRDATIQQNVLLLGVEPHSLLNFRKDLIIQLVVAGHRVRVASLAPSPEQAAALGELGVTVSAVAFSRAGMNPYRDLGTLLELVKLFKETKPDTVIAYTAKPVIYGAIAAKLSKVPRFVSMITGLGYSFVEGMDKRRKIARFAASFLYRISLPFSHLVIFQNPDDRQTFQDLGLLRDVKETGLVNGSGVDLNHYQVAELPDAPVFIMIARLLADKGVREYAAASKRLRDKFPYVRTLLVGRLDPSPNSITQDELDCWTCSGMEYKGYLDDVRPAIVEASIVVLPSYREGTPRSILEGMAMGRAIITTDAPGCRETVVPGENGLLVAPRDEQALFEAMEFLVTAPALISTMGAHSVRFAAQKFEGKAVARSVMQLAGLT